jgi:hypothetical protein
MGHRSRQEMTVSGFTPKDHPNTSPIGWITAVGKFGGDMPTCGMNPAHAYLSRQHRAKITVGRLPSSWRDACFMGAIPTDLSLSQRHGHNLQNPWLRRVEIKAVTGGLFVTGYAVGPMALCRRNFRHR